MVKGVVIRDGGDVVLMYVHRGSSVSGELLLYDGSMTHCRPSCDDDGVL